MASDEFMDRGGMKPTDPRRPPRRRPPSTFPVGTPKSPPPPHHSSNRQLPCAGWYWSQTKKKWKACKILEKLIPKMWKFEVEGVTGIFVKNDEDVRFRRPKNKTKNPKKQKKKEKKNVEERFYDSLLEMQKDRTRQSRIFDERIKKEAMATEKRLKREIEAAKKKFAMQVEAVEEKINLKVMASETMMTNKISIIEKRQQSLTERQDDLVRQHNEQMARIARRERIRANNKAAMFDLEQKKRKEFVDLSRRTSPPRKHGRRRSRDYERMNYRRRHRNH